MGLIIQSHMGQYHRKPINLPVHFWSVGGNWNRHNQISGEHTKCIQVLPLVRFEARTQLLQSTKLLMRIKEFGNCHKPNLSKKWVGFMAMFLVTLFTELEQLYHIHQGQPFRLWQSIYQLMQGWYRRTLFVGDVVFCVVNLKIDLLYCS